MARITGSDPVLLSMLADPDFGLRVAALNAVITSPESDTAVLATLHDAPVAWQRAVVRAVRRARRRDLADRLLLEAVNTDAGINPTLPLMPTLPRMPGRPRAPPRRTSCPTTSSSGSCQSARTRRDTTATRTRAPARRLETTRRRPPASRPRPHRPPARRTTRRPATHLVDPHAPTPSPPQPRADPEQVLALLERHPVWRRVPFPPGLAKQLGALAEYDASRTLRLLVDAAISLRHPPAPAAR